MKATHSKLILVKMICYVHTIPQELKAMNDWTMYFLTIPNAQVCTKQICTYHVWIPIFDLHTQWPKRSWQVGTTLFILSNICNERTQRLLVQRNFRHILFWHKRWEQTCVKWRCGQGRMVWSPSWELTCQGLCSPRSWELYPREDGGWPC